jgi:hypothetical protein
MSDKKKDSKQEHVGSKLSVASLTGAASVEHPTKVDGMTEAEEFTNVRGSGKGE